MAKLLKLRGGTTSQHSSFTGAEREVTVDTDKETLVVHDGSTAGGFPLMRNTVEDTTPQLGGNLDVNGNSIVSVSNGNIAITPNGSGKVILDGLSHPTSDGSAGQFLTTDGGGNLSFATVNTTTAFDDVTAGDAAINVTTTAGDITIDAQGNDTDIIFKGTDGGSDTTFLTIDGSEAGTATFNSGAVFGGSVLPASDDAIDLGSSSKQWRDIYTGDINLNNTKTRDNEVDGTRGSWTIQEGENDLFILNRLNGKKYKFKLEEIK